MKPAYRISSLVALRNAAADRSGSLFKREVMVRAYPPRPDRDGGLRCLAWKAIFGAALKKDVPASATWRGYGSTWAYLQSRNASMS
eukprot:6172300-Pleurochrysis_carterae.AAC.4